MSHRNKVVSTRLHEEPGRHDMLKITLGPNFYFWDRDKTYDFYQKIASSAVDVVYLGEAVCSKRRELRLEDWIEIGEELSNKGKEVVLSTLALISAESELKTLRRVVKDSPWLIEANDMATVHMLSEAGLPFVAGSAINTYNGRSLALLQQCGAKRWVLPVELSSFTLDDILNECCELTGDVPETEIFAYGYLPLAYSARCFTARHHNVPKDNCEFVCKEYPSGLRVSTQEHSELFTINGIQTQSGHLNDLCESIEGMAEFGVSHVRISPEPDHTLSTIKRYDDARNGRSVQSIPSSCNGYWYEKPGMDFIPVTLEE